MKKIIRLAGWLITALIAMTEVRADENMVFHGILLVNPPCQINNGNVLEVDFGEIGVNKISTDGNNSDLWRTVPLAISCEGADPELFVRYEGNVALFDSASVQTTVSGLGIQLRHGDTQQPVEMNSGWRLSNNNTDRKMIVTPIKDAIADLQAGPFEATANLKLEYD